MSGLANGAVQLSWLSLGPLSDSTDGVPGSEIWTFSAPDSYFIILPMARPSRWPTRWRSTTTMVSSSGRIFCHHHGSNDAPVIGAIAQHNLTEQVDASALTSNIAVSFTDLDLSDVGHSASITHAVASGATNGLALNESALIELIKPEDVTRPPGPRPVGRPVIFGGIDRIRLSEARPGSQLKYTVAIDDGDGGITSRDFVITVTGTNDAPSIVGETDPAPQTVIVAAPISLDVLDPGVIDNSLGLHTETFNQVTAGVASNNGTGHGNFFSEALGALLGLRAFRGRQRVVLGYGGAVCRAVARRPGCDELSEHRRWRQRNHRLYFGEEHLRPLLGFADFVQLHQVLRRQSRLSPPTPAISLAPLFPTGNQSWFASNGYVQFAHLPLFDKVVLASSENAFEIDNISAGYVPEDTGLSGPVTGRLSVHDADVGDALTGVRRSATPRIEYNGSTTIPAGIASSLLKAANVTFDTASSNGGTVDLHWTYQPLNADFGFIHDGDVLEIKYRGRGQ